MSERHEKLEEALLQSQIGSLARSHGVSEPPTAVEADTLLLLSAILDELQEIRRALTPIPLSAALCAPLVGAISVKETPND